MSAPTGLIYFAEYLREFSYPELSPDGMSEHQHVGVQFSIQAQADQLLQEPLVNRWLRTRLIADATLTGLVGQRVYLRKPPTVSGAFPCVVFGYVSPIRITKTIGGARILHALRYDVKAIVAGPDPAPAQLIMNRVLELVDRAALIAVA